MARAKKKDVASTSRTSAVHNNRSSKPKNEGIRNRASPARLVKLYKLMSTDQKKMIEDVGFGGLLNIGTGVLPAELSKWLINNFQAESSSLVIPGRWSISVLAEAVHRILGLPNGGDKVHYDCDAKSITFIHNKYNLEDGVAPPMKAIVKRLHENKDADEDYLRSWLMLAVSTFLCPTTCLGISPKCYPPLVNLQQVKNLNWCQFVVDSLKTAAHGMKSRNSVKGCLFFLVVLYLDSLAVDNVQISNCLPRVGAWKKQIIDKVIKLDTNINGDFGKLRESMLGRREDIERFVASKVTPGTSAQKRRLISDAVSKVSIGFTELLGNFISEISQNSDGEQHVHQDESTHRRSKWRRMNNDSVNSLESVSDEDADYEDEETEEDEEEFDSTQNSSSDDVQMSGDGEGGAETDTDVNETDEHGNRVSTAHDTQEQETDEEAEVPLLRRSNRRNDMESNTDRATTPLDTSIAVSNNEVGICLAPLTMMSNRWARLKLPENSGTANTNPDTSNAWDFSPQNATY